MQGPNAKTHINQAVFEAALAYSELGLSSVPILPATAGDAGKRPALTAWKPFQLRIPAEADLRKWYLETSELRGIALIGGAVSNNLECLDFDDPNALKSFVTLCREHDCAAIVDKLTLAVQTPKGGHHVWYRCIERPDGNTKLASLSVQNADGSLASKTYIETRGEKGYALVPPSPAACHPSGRAYKMLRGSFEQIPIITPEERNILHALARTLNQVPEAKKSMGSPAPGRAQKDAATGATLRPGDDYNLRGDYLALLAQYGWTISRVVGDKALLRRPGKSGHGWSATSNYGGANLFYVFSSNAFPFNPETSYTPFYVYALLQHGGDLKAATKALAHDGYGSRNDDQARKEWQEKQRAERRAQDKAARPPLVMVSVDDPQGFDEDECESATGEELPTIETNDSYLSKMSDEAYAALLARNQRLETSENALERCRLICVRGGYLHWLTFDESNRAIAAVMDQKALRHRLARSAWFIQTSAKGGEKRVPPKMEIVDDILARQDHPLLPQLEIVVSAPILAPDGVIQTEPGYSRSAAAIYHPQRPITIGSIEPTPDAVAAAREYIVSDILAEFPFIDQASRAHAVAAMILPFVRQVVDGPTPIHIVDAPNAGTGKGLLADVMTMVFSPDGAVVSTEAENEEEWRKRITAALMNAPSHVLLDNITRPLRSASLCAAITAQSWSDRILGASKTITLPVRCVWMATANNVELSDEITRRTTWIRMDAGVENPSLRDGFRRKNLRADVIAERSQLITAILTIVNAWQRAGRPLFTARKLGSFESWCGVIGGILEVAGIEGFLSNTADLMQKTDKESNAWREFVGAWHGAFGSMQVGLAELFPIAVEHLGDVVNFSGKEEKAQRTSLGMKLRRKVDRVFNGWKIIDAGSYNRATQYRLIDPKLGNSAYLGDHHEGNGNAQRTLYTENGEDWGED